MFLTQWGVNHNRNFLLRGEKYSFFPSLMLVLRGGKTGYTGPERDWVGTLESLRGANMLS